MNKSTRFDIFFASTSYIYFHLKELLERIEEDMDEINFYRCELIEKAKEKDIKLFMVNFNEEVSILKPKIVLMLGETIYQKIWEDKNIKKDDDNLRFYYKKINGIYYMPIKDPLKYNIFSDEIKEEYIRDLVLALSDLLYREAEDEL